MDNNKKKLYLVIIILVIIMIMGVGTYALSVWTSRENTELTFRIAALEGCIVNKGIDIEVSNIGPVFDYELDGEMTEFSVINATEEVATVNINFNITTITDNLKEESFKYVIFSSLDGRNYSILKEGNFIDVTNDSTIEILTDYSLIGSIYFKLYIYIDGNMINPITMQGGSLTGSVSINACVSEMIVTPEILEENTTVVDGVSVYSIPVVSGLDDLKVLSGTSVDLMNGVTYECANGKTGCSIIGTDVTDTSTLEVGTHTIYYTIDGNDGIKYMYPRNINVFATEEEYYDYTWDVYNVTQVTFYTWNKYRVATNTEYQTSTISAGSTILRVNEAESKDEEIGVATMTVNGRSVNWTATSFATLTGSSITISSPLNTPFNIGLENTYYTKSKQIIITGSTTFTIGSYRGYSSNFESSYLDYKVTANVAVSEVTGTTTTEVQGSFIEAVSTTTSGTYPTNGKSGSYWYVYNGTTTTNQKGTTSYNPVYSDNANAYPTNGEQNGYWYVRR